MKALIILALLICPLAGFAQQGYTIKENRIVVEEVAQWEQWEYPKGLLELDEEGGIKPRFVHKNINACLDATEFGGGVKDAGSNLADVAKAMDGDMSTFWEPDRDAPLEDWWFEIDLGRLVSAKNIVLRFLGEGQGDPFLQFRISTSAGGRITTWDPKSSLDYHLSWKSPKPDRSQRLFDIELRTPLKWTSRTLEGDAIQYIKVMVTDSDRERRELLSEQEYRALDPELRGAIDYYRITEAGEERLTTEERYRELSPERRGSVKYYRRELPRLAEVEVWTFGENIALGTMDRGGSVDLFSTGSGGSGANALDGAYVTGAQLLPYSEALGWEGMMVDLGAVFWVNRIRIIVLRFGLTKYELLGSEGLDYDRTGDLTWHRVAEDSSWTGELQIDARFDLQKTRFVKLRQFYPGKIRPSFGGASRAISELQVYGEGYPPEVVLLSPLIDVGEGRNLTSIEWDGEASPGTRVEIRTRTGDSVQEIKHYYDSGGKEVTATTYNRLPGFARGPVSTQLVPDNSWSLCSRLYEHSGDPFQSPSPREYLQIRVKLLSDDPYQAPSLKSLSIPFTTPLTERISGTMSPQEVQRLGAPEVFTLKLHPLLQEWHPGFNQLLIQTLDRMEVKLVKMEVKKDSLSTDLTDQVEILPTQPDSLWMVLPDTIQTGDAQEIELQFQSALYRDSTPFNVFVGHTSLPGVWQQVESEDFHPFLHTFIVFVPLDKKMIDNVEIVPSVLTPNGDGVNDVLTIHFTVGRIKAPRDVRVTIYDLRGRSVRHMVERRQKYPLGRYAMEWDGRDDGGRLVNPGMYVVVIRVHSNWEEARNTEVKRRVVVVY